VAIVATAGGVIATAPARPAAAADSYRALAPERILDTRVNKGASGPVGAGQAITLDVTGVGGVPDSGVAAVVLNVTATNATQGTYVTVWPTGQAKPNTSNLNVQPNTDTPNAVIATVGADGTIQLANEFGATHLLADVSGWIPAGSEYTALTPDRVLDTRVDKAAAGPVGPEGTIAVKVTGVAGVPAGGVSAVVLNVTAVEATEPTYVTVWPSGQPKPNTSNLNVRPGIDTPNLVIATVGTDGTIQLANQFGSLNLIADVSGYFTGGTGYRALTPDRVLDTRQNIGAAGPVPAQGSIDVQVTGLAGVPATGVSAVVLNVTAAQATDGTYITVWPSGYPKPEASSLNVQPHVDTPNLVIATVGAGGKVSLANQFGSTHLIADVAGYFTGTPPNNPSNPGTLWAGGNGDVWRYALGSAPTDWESRGDFGETFTVDPVRRELIQLGGPVLDPSRVEVRDLDTHQLKEEFTWVTDAWDAEGLEVSPDGQTLAAIMSYTSGDTWVEVLRRGDRSVVDIGLDQYVTDLEFTPNGDLLIVVDWSDAEGAPLYAAIGLVLQDQLSAPITTFKTVQTFTAAQGVPGSLAVSNDNQLLFSRAGALWVTTAVEDGPPPHQLTTGPENHLGGVFSPDGSRIAFVLPSIAAQFQRQYVIPNHRGTPLYIAPGDTTADQYMIGQDNLVTSMVAWLT
jgi:hypothetical protein